MALATGVAGLGKKSKITIDIEPAGVDNRIHNALHIDILGERAGQVLCYS